MSACSSHHGEAEPRSAPALSVIVPTFNERDNLPVLFDRLAVALRDISWEMIVVDDDSTDGTWNWARDSGAKDARLRCLRRVDRRGLAGPASKGPCRPRLRSSP